MFGIFGALRMNVLVCGEERKDVIYMYARERNRRREKQIKLSFSLSLSRSKQTHRSKTLLSTDLKTDPF